jgi:hypothetical protein
MAMLAPDVHVPPPSYLRPEQLYVDTAIDHGALLSEGPGLLSRVANQAIESMSSKLYEQYVGTRLTIPTATTSSTASYRIHDMSVNGTTLSLDSIKASLNETLADSLTATAYAVPYEHGIRVRWDVGYAAQTTKSVEQMAKEAIQKLIRQNLLIKTGRRIPVSVKVSPQELKARETLRDMLSERDWRRYVTNGFIMVRGRELGRYWYQLFANRSERVRIYERGTWVKSLCIHTDSVCPPTDHVINMKVLIEIDEKEIWSGANTYQGGDPSRDFAPTKSSPSNLVEHLQKIKAQAKNERIERESIFAIA